MKALFIIALVFFLISFVLLRNTGLMLIFGLLMVMATIGQAIIEILKRKRR